MSRRDFGFVKVLGYGEKMATQYIKGSTPSEQFSNLKLSRPICWISTEKNKCKRVELECLCHTRFTADINQLRDGEYITCKACAKFLKLFDWSGIRINNARLLERLYDAPKQIAYNAVCDCGRNFRAILSNMLTGRQGRCEVCQSSCYPEIMGHVFNGVRFTECIKGIEEEPIQFRGYCEQCGHEMQATLGEIRSDRFEGCPICEAEDIRWQNTHDGVNREDLRASYPLQRYADIIGECYVSQRKFVVLQCKSCKMLFRRKSSAVKNSSYVHCARTTCLISRNIFQKDWTDYCTEGLTITKVYALKNNERVPRCDAKCECGAVLSEVSLNDVLNGDIGKCAKCASRSWDWIVGNTRNGIHFLRRAENTDAGMARYEGKCVECGATKVVCTSNLSTGRFGCTSCASVWVKERIAGKIIPIILKDSNIEYITQKALPVRGTGNGHLRADGLLVVNGEIVCMLEYNGSQHYKSSEYFGGATAFVKTKIHDNRKRRYVQEHGIRLLTLDDNDCKSSKSIELTEIAMTRRLAKYFYLLGYISKDRYTEIMHDVAVLSKSRALKAYSAKIAA